MSIQFYDPKKEYGQFSNYYDSPITINNIKYSTTEHYYQALKFLGNDQTSRSVEYAQLILSQSTPNKAKILACQKVKGSRYKWLISLNDLIRQYSDVNIRSDWEIMKDNVMRTAVMYKFQQHANLKELLLSTDDNNIYEYIIRDSYWGDGGDGSGQNMLGRILMETRHILRGQILEQPIMGLLYYNNIYNIIYNIDDIIRSISNKIPVSVNNPNIIITVFMIIYSINYDTAKYLLQ